MTPEELAKYCLENLEPVYVADNLLRFRPKRTIIPNIEIIDIKKHGKWLKTYSIEINYIIEINKQGQYKSDNEYFIINCKNEYNKAKERISLKQEAKRELARRERTSLKAEAIKNFIKDN